MDKAEEKKILRKEYLRRREALSAKERTNASGIITAKLMHYLEEVSPNRKTDAPFRADAGQTEPSEAALLLYISIRSEVNTGAFLEQQTVHKLHKLGYQIFAPRVDADAGEMDFYCIRSAEDLQPGYYGIMEPKQSCEKYIPSARAEEACIIFVPGSVFDTAGNRMGYGGGFYDRYLTKLSGTKLKTHTIGLCYDLQVSDEPIPTEATDRRLNQIVTERRTIWN